MKIGIMGTHGTGKSTLALRLAADRKQKYPRENVGVLTETARGCPFQINKDMTLEAQLWIYHAQFKAELEMAARYDTLICDRTVLDNLAYSRYAGFNDLCNDCLYPALDWFGTYDELYWLRPDKLPADDGFRNTDPEFQKDIDRIFQKWVIAYHLPVTSPEKI